MHIYIERSKEKKNIDFTGTVAALLNHLNINSEAVLVSRNNELLTEDDVIESADNIQILSVVSGG